jgi:hypothetical protein
MMGDLWALIAAVGSHASFCEEASVWYNPRTPGWWYRFRARSNGRWSAGFRLHAGDIHDAAPNAATKE